MLKLGLVLLKLALSLVGGIPLPGVIEALGTDLDVHKRYVDKALSLVNMPDKIEEITEEKLDSVVDAEDPTEMLKQIDASTEGSRLAYETIRELLEKREGYNIATTCGLRQVVCRNGKCGWVLNKDDVQKAYEDANSF